MSSESTAPVILSCSHSGKSKVNHSSYACFLSSGKSSLVFSLSLKKSSICFLVHPSLRFNFRFKSFEICVRSSCSLLSINLASGVIYLLANGFSPSGLPPFLSGMASEPKRIHIIVSEILGAR